MPRRAGIGAIKNKQADQARFKDKGAEIAEGQLESLTNQLGIFQKYLNDFAIKHKDKIRQNPQFRRQFQDMCASVGVDPLTSSKGFWAELLGVGDFYYELGVQIIEVCLSTQHRNGGIMRLSELKQRIMKSGGRARQDITDEDLLTAIKKLKVLGSGFVLINLAESDYLVQSVPMELSKDHTEILRLSSETGFVTQSMLSNVLNWREERSKQSLDCLLREGLVWIDTQHDGETAYWFPSLSSNVNG